MFATMVNMIRPGLAAIPTSPHLMSGRDLAERNAEHGLLPVNNALHAVLPRGALERGCVYQCTGVGASSLAWALVAQAVSEGSWLALVDVPHAGLLSAREYGIALERLLCIDTSRVTAHWSRMMGALVDGIDVVVTASPRCSTADARTLSARCVLHHCDGYLVATPVSVKSLLSPKVVVHTAYNHNSCCCHSHLTNSYKPHVERHAHRSNYFSRLEQAAWT